MSVAQETPHRTEEVKLTPRRPNGRWSGYRHLLMARMLELKREPEVIFWVFVFPLLLALGLGIAFRNKPGSAVPVAIVRTAGAEKMASLLEQSASSTFKVQVVSADEAQNGFRLGKYDLIVEPAQNGAV